MKNHFAYSLNFSRTFSFAVIFLFINWLLYIGGYIIIDSEYFAFYSEVKSIVGVVWAAAAVVVSSHIFYNTDLHWILYGKVAVEQKKKVWKTKTMNGEISKTKFVPFYWKMYVTRVNDTHSNIFVCYIQFNEYAICIQFNRLIMFVGWQTENLKIKAEGKMWVQLHINGLGCSSHAVFTDKMCDGVIYLNSKCAVPNFVTMRNIILCSKIFTVEMLYWQLL